jgi:uncharacterized membrane protein
MHPWEIHPALVHFPIAFLTGGVLLDLFGWVRKRESLTPAATGLIITGTVTALFTAAAGFLAYFTVPAHTEEAHGLMQWHLGLNVGIVAVFTALSIGRWRARALVPSGVVRLVGVFALALLFFASYLGGEMVYKGGAGIDPDILSPEITHTHVHHHETSP